MRSVRIQRYNVSRRRKGACGCFAILATLLVLVMGGLLLVTSGLLLSVLLQLFGVDRIGQTDSVFSDNPRISESVMTLQNPVPIQQVTVRVPGYTTYTITNSSAVNLQIGQNPGGINAVTAQIDEAGLLTLCNQYSDLCRGSGGTYRNVRFDLRPGGGIIYADVNMGIWQQVGIVLQLDSSSTRFSVAGVDINGVLYDAQSFPSEVSSLVDEIHQHGNTILAGMIVNAGGNALKLSYIEVDEQQVQVYLEQ